MKKKERQKSVFTRMRENSQPTLHSFIIKGYTGKESPIKASFEKCKKADEQHL